MIKQLLTILFIAAFGCTLSSQENHFSQFYTSPQYVNPAFAGDVHFMKAGIAARANPQNSSGSIVNSLVHFDYKMINQKSGLGFTFYSHTETLRHLKFQLNYGHTIRLNDNAYVRAGLGFSLNQRSTPANDFLYPDQYNSWGPSGVATQEPSLQDNSYFPAIAAGAVIYNKILWLSFSADYLNMPKETFAGMETVYDMKFSFMGGMLYPLNKTSSKRRFSRFGGLSPFTSLGPVVCFIYQGDYVEASAGITINHKPFFTGVHYRYQHDYRQSENKYAYKAMVAMAGYRQEEFAITYSYDITLSSYSFNKKGAHEISAIFYFSTWKPDYNRQGLVPLPNQLFY